MKKVAKKGRAPATKKGARKRSRTASGEQQRLITSLRLERQKACTKCRHLEQSQANLLEKLAHCVQRFAHAPVANMTITPNGIIQEANQTAATMLDVERTDLIGAQFSRYVARESLGTWMAHCESLADNADRVCEVLLQPQHGAVLHVRLISRTCPGSSSCAGSFYTTLLDVSDLVNALSRSRQSEAKLRSLFETLPAMAYWGARDGGRTFLVNHEVEAVLGSSHDETAAKHVRWNEYVDPEDRTRVAAHFAGLVPGERVRLQYRIADAKGCVRWIHDCAVAPLEGLGDEAGFAGILVDVTDQYRATQAMQRLAGTLEDQLLQQRLDLEAVREQLRLRSKQYKAVQSESELARFAWQRNPGAIIWFQANGQVFDANEIACELTGYSYKNLLALSLYDLVPDFPPNAWKSRWDSIMSRVTAGLDFTLRTNDGRAVPVELTLAGMQGEDHALACVFIRDVRDRSQLQRQIVAIAEEERRRIGQDLHDVTQQDLVAVGLLAESLAIELAKQQDRNAEELQSEEEARSGELNSMIEEISGKVREAVQHVRLLAKGLIPRQVGAEQLVPALKELVHEATHLQPSNNSKSGKLRHKKCTFKSSESISVGDAETATHLFRIAQEALANALKHANASDIRVSLDQTKKETVLAVLDNGIGMGDKRGIRHGVGLTVMENRARAIGAKLRIEQPKEGGTLVTCTLASS